MCACMHACIFPSCLSARKLVTLGKVSVARSFISYLVSCLSRAGLSEQTFSRLTSARLITPCKHQRPPRLDGFEDSDQTQNRKKHHTKTWMAREGAFPSDSIPQAVRLQAGWLVRKPERHVCRQVSQVLCEVSWMMTVMEGL